jgi:Undecaprenyl-phosphate galactose phosphotransferase WbaP
MKKISSIIDPDSTVQGADMHTILGTSDSSTTFRQPAATYPTAMWRYSRTWMTSLLVLSDLLSLTLAGIAAVYLRVSIGQGVVDPPFYIRMLPLELIFIGFYTLRGLYPAVGISPVEELRRLTISTSAVFFFITAYAFWVRSVGNYSRLVLALAWIFSLVTVQLGRWSIRILAVHLGIWGEPIAVIGYGAKGREIILYLLKKLHLGLRPVLVIDGSDHPENDTPLIPGLLYQSYDFSSLTHEDTHIQTAVLVSSEIPESMQASILDKSHFSFRRLIVIPELHLTGTVGVVSHDLEGMLGLEVCQNLLQPVHRFIKRCMDIILVVFAGIFATPLGVLIAVFIRLDSPGKIFFGQHRVGRDGRQFMTWKFRTMVVDAEYILEDCLGRDTSLREEWESTQKLKNDPRLTRVGKVLRRLSLDELPQLYNILVGDMSLVGPRPFTPDQKNAYGKAYQLYAKVRPGLTGMWQVSGRNSTTFQERALWDEYYVRNWSVWLDIYILLRTIWVVIKRDGAY